MRLLLDTHVALWLMSRELRVSDAAMDEFSDDSNQVLLSAVVIWEVAVKRALGKLDAPRDMAEQLAEVHVDPLPVSMEHAAAVEHLPPHHRDPFDRLLVAQAQVENATILSADPRLRAYDVRVLW